ncbi:MAG TPA: cytochrome-c peroxidase [Anaerolineae bacterium]|nr:cytochrome-c peroxidase [Anaerolineae bacterium]
MVTKIQRIAVAWAAIGVILAPPYELIPIENVRPAEDSVETFTELPTEHDDALVALGKYLFFDPRLPGDFGLGCATCHQPDNASSNLEALSPGYTGTPYFRNAPTIMNTVFQDFLHWDGRMDGADMYAHSGSRSYHGGSFHEL